MAGITASGLYATTFTNIFNATQSAALNLTLATYKIALLSNSWTPNFDTDAAWTSTNEVTGTNWATTGKTLSVAAVGGTSTVPLAVHSITPSYFTYDMGDVNVATVTFTLGRGAIIYADPITTPSAKPPIVLINFGADYGPTAGTFGITWDALGVFRIQLA